MTRVNLIKGFALIAVMAWLGWHLKSLPTQYVFLDREYLQAQLIQQLAIRKADDAQVLNTLKKFKRCTQTVLAEYATSHHAIIVDKKIMIEGGKDVTNDILKLVSVAMREIK